ncbi:hypothetical protein D3C85_983040 [compost metagenome]
MQPRNIGPLPPIAAHRVHLVRRAVFEQGALILRVVAPLVGAALFATRCVGGVVAGAVEEEAHAQGDALLHALFQLFFLVLFFQAQRSCISWLFLPVTSKGVGWALRQVRRAGGQGLGSAGADGQWRGRGKGRRGMAVADQHGAGTGDHHIAVAADRAERGGRHAVDQHSGDHIAGQCTAAGSGVALAGGGQAVELNIRRAGGDGVAAVPGNGAGGGVADSGGGFAGHDQSPYRLWQSGNLAGKRLRSTITYGRSVH